VGKENAAAQAFNYAATTNGGTVQNSAFAIGTAGTLTQTNVGMNNGTATGGAASSAANQGNTIGNGYTINVGTVSGDVLGTAKP
jgi:hypothetical protein